jgi:hypothetical protein
MPKGVGIVIVIIIIIVTKFTVVYVPWALFPFFDNVCVDVLFQP